MDYMVIVDDDKYDEINAINYKLYVPKNSVLVVAGDIDFPEVKKMINQYFGSIPKGAPIERGFAKEDPITEQITSTEYDSNIQIPALALCYRTPAMTERDSYVLNMIATYLSDGKTSKLYKTMVDENKSALQVFAFNRTMEDYSMYNIF